MPRAFAHTVWFLWFAAASAFAGETQIPVSGWGTLSLAVPDGWRQQLEKRQATTTATFTPDAGNGFTVMVSPLPFVQGSSAPVTQDSVRRYVAASAEQAKAQSVESSIPLRSFPAGAAFGSYFSATDRAPKPGEYKYMTQGLIAIEGQPVAFTILTNGDAQAIVEPVLRMLQSARKR